MTGFLLSCAGCRQTKTAARMRPASPGQAAEVVALRKARVQPKAPALLCDDQQGWARWTTTTAGPRTTTPAKALQLLRARDGKDD